MPITQETLLKFREQKFRSIQQLVEEFKKPALVLSINKPTQSTVDTKNLFLITEKEVSHLFYPLVHQQKTTDEHGNYAVLIPKSLFAQDLKKKAVWYEENAPHGRLIDLDVMDENGAVLHRKKQRVCFICGENVAVCRHTQKHTISQLDDYIYSLAKSKTQTLFDELATKAISALSFELLSAPKPGLVDTISSGAHKDMDYSTFLKSINSLFPYFSKCAEIGFSQKDVLCRLRKAGKNAEHSMYQATGGINTHKGAIFTLGLSTAAAANHFYNQPTLGTITETIAQYTKGICSELENETTHGAMVYKRYGIKGPRGEVEQGLPNVTKAYDMLTKCLMHSDDVNDALLCTLLTLMSHVEDSNILYRKNMDTLKRVQADAKKALELNKKNRLDVLKDLDCSYSSKRISPGGSADLLSVTCFFVLVLQPHLLPLQLIKKNMPFAP